MLGMAGNSPPGDIEQCRETVSVVLPKSGAVGIRWVEARDAAQHPSMPRMPHKEQSGPTSEGKPWGMGRTVWRQGGPFLSRFPRTDSVFRRLCFQN